MKKVLKFTAAAIMAVCALSCTKDNGDDNKVNNGKDEEQEQPGGEENPGGDETPAAAITIDGTFSDWDAVETVDATAPAGVIQDGISKVRVYGDDMYLYMYLEMPLDGFTYDGADGYVPLSICIDTDGNPDTGATIDWMWMPAAFEAILQGNIAGPNSEFVSFNPGVTVWTGEDGMGYWDDESAHSQLVTEGSGVGTGAGVVDGDIVKYELSIIKEFIPEMGSTIKLGVYLSDKSWGETGRLPIGEHDSEAGSDTIVEMLTYNF